MMIRRFRLNDHAPVLDLWKHAGLILRPGDDLEGIKLKLKRDPDLFLVTEEHGEVVGVVMGSWDGRRGWINHLAVRHDYQRKGIGTALIEELERRLTQKGARKINAQIYRSNKKSIRFFKAAGYGIHSDLVMIGKFLRS